VPEAVAEAKEGFKLEFFTRNFRNRVYVPLARDSNDDSGYQKSTLPHPQSEIDKEVNKLTGATKQ
jgi:hypothetical protein